MTKAVPGFPPELQWKWFFNSVYRVEMKGPSAMINNIISMGYGNWEEQKNVHVNVRGVNVTTYKATLNNGNLTVYAYQQLRKWESPLRRSSRYRGPLIRLKLIGTLPPHGEPVQEKTDVNMDIDIINIKNGLAILDREFLEIPIARGCNGTNELKPTSFHESDFIVNGEIFVTNDRTDDVGDQNVSKITNFKIINSYEYSTYEIIQDNFSNAGKLVPLGTYKTVVIGSGYKFYTNLDDGNCVIKPYKHYGLSLNLPNGEILYFQSPSSLFNFTDYKYLGMTKRRGIFASVFEKTVNHLDGYMHLETSKSDKIGGAILTYYQHTQLGSYHKFLPIKLEIRILNGKFKNSIEVVRLITIDFTNFNTFAFSVEPLETISIENCLENAKSHLSFQITYKAASRHSRIIPSKVIINAFVESVNALYEISPLRIINPMVTYQKHGLKLTAVLLERPPATIEFDKNKYGVMFKNVKTYPTYYFTLSNEECAQHCLRYVFEKLCISYVWCNFNCYLYVAKVPDDGMVKPADMVKANTTDNAHCIYAHRMLPSLIGDVAMIYNSMVIDDILVAIDTFRLPYNVPIQSLNISVRYQYNHYKYYPVSLTTNLPGNADTKLDGANYKVHFHLDKLGYNIIGKYVKVEFSDQFNDFNDVEFCSDKCLKEADFYCESFSYCAEDTSCYLTDINPVYGDQTNASIIFEQVNCGIYSRNYVEHYQEFDGIEINAKGSRITVSGPNECAKKCTNTKDLGNGKYCQSFDMCYQKDSTVNYCFLHDTHLLDITSTDEIKATKYCKHFSRMYIDDYIMKNDYQIRGEYVAFKYNHLTVENCSKICSQTSDCTAFDICNSNTDAQSVCSLTTTTHITSNITIGNFLCDFYKGKHNGQIAAAMPKPKPTSKPIPKPNSRSFSVKNDGDANKRISSGFVIGSAIGTFVLGILIAAGVLHLYFKRRSNI